MTKAPLLIAALAAAPLLAGAHPAFAQGRPSSVAMTCGQARALVRSRGAVILGTGGQTYDRYVADRTFCQATEELRPGWVPTRDTPSCLVGYRCREPFGTLWDYR